MSIQSHKSLTQDVSAQLAKLRQSQSEVMAGFSQLAQAAIKDGALEKKTKEFVALGIAVASRCDDCIGFHVQTLVKLGATRAEVEEVLGTAVYMGGGPSLMYAAHALKAYEEFAV
ncbi:carboxymuconolactone decarboxylase family protein [Oryzomicrobium sp.]|uniref:carboxymuconolactone decarboxylase family protein n=1 Tax=Oryzomicrobium sp. TaxID=1911578 RepID=UPI0025D4AD61|nr:carboxymuconolactone decarboxylase family protein [Oryzomicrobium sp.]MCE1244191.1 carboxymuconolactone decarboxylase family protein [Oryzomicrobium sp.]